MTGHSLTDWHKCPRRWPPPGVPTGLPSAPPHPESYASPSCAAMSWPTHCPAHAYDRDQGGPGGSVRVGVTETRALVAATAARPSLLVAGATGAGKAAVLWSLIAGIAPAVRTGQVRLCVIDPKGGMELGRGSDPVHACSPTTPPAPPSTCCGDWSRSCTGGANRLRGHTRLHTPTPSEPLFVRDRSMRSLR